MKRIMVKMLGALVVGLMLKLQVSTAFAQGMSSTLLMTLTNPTPTAYEQFGVSVAAVGSDYLLIGTYRDYDAGAAYLFSTNGTLLTTFTNPAPAVDDYFGFSVSAVGSARVVIGAWQDDTGAPGAGEAYMFSTTGTLLATFTNPTPADYEGFGYSVAAVGFDRVLIGAIQGNAGALHAGAAYMFGTNGTLLTIFTNPTPAATDQFSCCLAALDEDRVLIGACQDDAGAFRAGAAYMFDTNGALLTTFTNPTPESWELFGWAITAVGLDRVLIGARQDAAGASNAGAAYLFDTNGVLLTTFTNPAPAVFSYFGSSVAALGSDWVLIGAEGTSGRGAAYLFTTSGKLLVTLTNPAPAVSAVFARSVAVVGTERVLVGTPYDGTVAERAGAAYMFSVVPNLAIGFTTSNTVAVSWPSPSTGWELQQNTNSVSSVNWSNSPGPIQDDGTTKTLIVNPPSGNRFYRLSKP